MQTASNGVEILLDRGWNSTYTIASNTHWIEEQEVVTQHCGPFVMNTKEQIIAAMDDDRAGRLA